MYFEDNFNPAEPNVYDDAVDNQKKKLNDALIQDRGLNVIKRKVFSEKTGRMKEKSINIYTSSGPGTRIRDAETGEYYSNRVGSADEDLYFKVILATGECTSSNGSSTLFYCSPQHYESHLKEVVSQDTISKWEEKRNNRLRVLKVVLQSKQESVIVH